MNVLESGLTFFECVSRTLGGRRTGLQTHDELLFYLMNIVFENAHYANFAEFCQAIRNEKTKQLMLKPTLVNNSAVKQWIKRFHSREKGFAQTPDVWYMSYPKLLKGAMLRFFWYHHDYASKPGRIYCKRVFAHLTADLYQCSVGIIEDEGRGERMTWFYPLDASDYYRDESLVSIVVRQEKDLSFSLIKPPPAVLDLGGEPPLLLQGGEEDFVSIDATILEIMAAHKFVLRLAQEEKLNNGSMSRKNNVVAEFENLGNDVYVCYYTPPLETLEDDIYQIYPGDETKTFFQLGLGEIIVVYCIVEKGKAIVCARHDMNDQYPFFRALPQTNAIVVIVARNLAESANALMKETEFVL